MGSMDEKNSEKIEIICPCGHQFDPPVNEGEFSCPACKRVHVLHGAGMIQDISVNAKGDTTVQTVPPPLEIQSGETIGPYTVSGFIGEGGMGRVYAGEDPNLRRRVAIKVLSRQFLDKRDFVARFEREARAIARLNNPNIVQIYFTGIHNGVPYYAMEMVPGGSLDVFKDDNPLTPNRAVELMLDAAGGLKAAAEEGVIHRDIKPSNLMLDRTGHLKITDFGLAKTVTIDSAITHTGTIIGTPYYMSPEQGEGESLDLRADIYSLGATFYHLLAGSPPYEADSPIGVILKHINEPLPPLVKKNRDLPRELCNVIEKMMAKDPGDRYETYSELIRDLKAIQQGLPPEATTKRKQRATKKDPDQGAVPAEGKRKSFIVLDREILESDETVALRRCGMFRRALAMAADFAILCLLYNLYIHQTQTVQKGDLFVSVPMWSALFLIISFLYFFLGDARGGMTLGKIFFRCRLGVRDGENLGFAKSLIRTLLFFPMLIAPGAMAADLPHDSPLLTFAQALQDLFFVEGSARIDQALYLIAQICLVWSLISLGFFLLTPGKTFLHDLISGAFLFSFSRRKGVKEDAPPGRTKPAAYTAKTPSQIPPGPKPAPIAHPVGPPPIPKDAIFPGPMSQPMARYPAHPPKSPRLAMVLSLFPGLGQFYNGDFMKGLLILLTFWLFIPWILGIFDAYFKACWINRQAGFID